MMSRKVTEMVGHLLGWDVPSSDEVKYEREQLEREIDDTAFAARELRHTLRNQTQQQISLQSRMVRSFSDVEALLARREAGR